MTKPTVAAPSIGFKIESGNLYGYATSDGSTFYTELLISSYTISGTPTTHEFEAILDPGVSVEYYVEGNLEGTLTSGVPSSGTSQIMYDYYVETGSTYNTRLYLLELKKTQEP